MRISSLPMLIYPLSKMVIKVKVIPKAKKEKVIKETDYWKVYVKAPAVEGKANKRLIQVLAEWFDTKKVNVTILRGEKSREKIVEINI